MLAARVVTYARASMYLARFALPIAALLLSSCGGTTDDDRSANGSTTASLGPPVQKGRLERWPEATMHLSVSLDASGAANVGLVRGKPDGLGAFWSIASTRGAGSGYFYSAPLSGDSQVALAPVGRVQDIRDASHLDFANASVGPLPEGSIVVMHHPPSGRYMALVLDAIEAVDPRTTSVSPWAYADVTWYLAADGSADFSAAP